MIEELPPPMRIAVGSDEPYPVHAVLISELSRRGFEIVKFGSLSSGREEPWAEVAFRAARAVADGSCDEAVLLCWTGTGICMAANKVATIRAALCTDAVTARGARTWNHANVLCLSNRLLSDDLCKEILEAWFSPWDKNKGAAGVEHLSQLEGV